MAKAKSEQIKLYVVIGLSIVAAVLAYFRFGRKPSAPSGPKPKAAVTAYSYEIPTLPAELAEASAAALAAPLPYSPPSRDVFAPASDRPAEGSGPAAEPRLTDGRPQLSAVIKGAKSSVAVINGEIMQIGKTFGPYTVAEIGKQHVVLLKDDERIILKIRR